MVTKVSKAVLKLGDHSVHQEWQHGRGYLYRTIKRRGQKIGELRKTDSGVVFVTPRLGYEITCRDSAWGIDVSTSSVLRMLGRPGIMVVNDKGESWKASDETFREKAVRKTYEYANRPASHQFVLAFEHWEYTPGSSDSIEQALKIGKWK